jgi:hypothetical protein
MTVISFPIEIFRRLNAQITAFYEQKVAHAVLASKQARQLAKLDHSSILAKNDLNFLPDSDISTFKRRNYCIYAQNIVHVVLSVETSPTTRETRSFVDFKEK